MVVRRDRASVDECIFGKSGALWRPRTPSRRPCHDLYWTYSIFICVRKGFFYFIIKRHLSSYYNSQTPPSSRSQKDPFEIHPWPSIQVSHTQIFPRRRRWDDSPHDHCQLFRETSWAIGCQSHVSVASSLQPAPRVLSLVSEGPNPPQIWYQKLQRGRDLEKCLLLYDWSFCYFHLAWHWVKTKETRKKGKVPSLVVRCSCTVGFRLESRRCAAVMWVMCDMN